MWEEALFMKFNVAKCHSVRVTKHRPPHQFIHGYFRHIQVLGPCHLLNAYELLSQVTLIGVNILITS